MILPFANIPTNFQNIRMGRPSPGMGRGGYFDSLTDACGEDACNHAEESGGGCRTVWRNAWCVEKCTATTWAADIPLFCHGHDVEHVLVTNAFLEEGGGICGWELVSHLSMYVKMTYLLSLLSSAAMRCLWLL